MKTLLILASVALLSFVNPKDDLISWGSRSIEWSDFKARPNTSFKTVALTASTITLNSKYDANNNLIIVIENFFITNKSWTSTSDSIVLEHERRHFDLSEVYARKIRKALKEKKFNVKKLNEEVNAVFVKYNKDLGNQQKLYDSETNHSINKTMQKQWSARIEAELIELSEFGDAACVLNY
jgi:hypothetical protein